MLVAPCFVLKLRIEREEMPLTKVRFEIKVEDRIETRF